MLYAIETLSLHEKMMMMRFKRSGRQNINYVSFIIVRSPFDITHRMAFEDLFGVK